ncbi:YobI family P-loop NTPase [Flavobacterium daejeonense]|uniref:YobI family P-loop NTPase n=1 Tax=Flavobacterium daejeonense TaxID=350893 RepID=UPI00047A96D0|nr:hypothetical protein [Flavobacterium daejeonense]
MKNKIINFFKRIFEWVKSFFKKFSFKVLFLTFLDTTIAWLQSIHSSFSNDKLENNAYSSLSPIDNSDEDGKYSEALLWALKNRKKEDIKNIALTGPYGSGKSSILKTFQKNYNGCDLKFLNISLATFKEEKKIDDQPEEKKDKNENKYNGKNGNTADLLRLIEISILEQIFFHEKDSKIPDSQFKKIKSFSKTTLFLTSIGYLLFIVAIYNYFNPYFIQSILKDFPINNFVCDIIHYTSIVIIIIGIYFIIRKSIRLISAITISKLKIQNAEISIGDSLNKSILNHHIDELLYFFSVCPYNVVIIEDLDRFEETEIFTKLRELNLLLNNSKKTKKKDIVFIYAVRDNMFTDKERTKFFDFIIPVIPIINSSNSSEILLRKRNKFNLELTDAFIEDISFFIDDMRLLHNITNEFHLYTKKLNQNLIPNKLFGIITYKNIYPNDFMKLSQNEGELYHIFSAKSDYIKEIVTNTDLKIEDYKGQITNLEEIFFDNTTDLRKLYLAQIISQLPGFISFVINSVAVDISSAITNENFEYIKSINFSYNQMRYDAYGREITQIKQPNFKFATIEKLVHPSKLYLEREKEITEIKNGKISALKNNVQELELQKQKARNYKLSELILSNQLSEIQISENLNKDLMLILLRNGYIAEDYTDYISLFHEESITRTDYQFLINIKNKNRQPFEYKLSKLEKLTARISAYDFQTEYTLNYDLLDYLLLNSGNYNIQINSVFTRLKDESKITSDFIKGYYEITPNLEKFIQKLCGKWPNIWDFIASSPDYSDKLRTRIFKSILEFAELDTIKKIAQQSSFKTKILSDSLFLNSIENTNKLKNIIEQLNLSFSKIDFENSNDEMLTYIYQNNLHDIDIQLIAPIIKTFGVFNQIDFDNSNYYAIKNSEAQRLIQHIELNFEKYIENIYLKIPTNCNEKLDSYIELLNHPTLKIRNKELIISQVNTKINKLSNITDDNLYEILLDNNKIIATWENLLFAYNSQELTENEEEKEIFNSIINFINILDNAQQLSNTKIPKETEIYNGFWKKILNANEIDNDSYDLITTSGHWWYSDLKFEELSQEKIKTLIKNTCIKPTKESYDKLKEYFDGLNITLFEKRKTDYFKILNELTFDSRDLKLVLLSRALENPEKLKIINTCSIDTIKTNANLQLIASILLNDASFTVDDEIIKSILINGSVPTDNRIKIFIKYSSKYDNAFIDSFLKSLGGDYADITNTSLKAKLVKSEDHNKLLFIIKHKGYISSYSEKEKHYMVNHKRKQ